MFYVYAFNRRFYPKRLANEEQKQNYSLFIVVFFFFICLFEFGLVLVFFFVFLFFLTALTVLFGFVLFYMYAFNRCFFILSNMQKRNKSNFVFNVA